MQALQWIAEQGDNARPEDIAEILGMIERHHLMSPLLVSLKLPFTFYDLIQASKIPPGGILRNFNGLFSTFLGG